MVMENDTGFCVKNTFIERDDEEEEANKARRAGRRAYRTLPPDTCMNRLDDEDEASEAGDITGGAEEISTALDNQRSVAITEPEREEQSPILLGSRQNLLVKQTFIHITADEAPPAAGKRRMKTCAVDGRIDAEPMEYANDDDSGDASDNTSGALDLDATPAAATRHGRHAMFQTEVLQEEFEYAANAQDHSGRHVDYDLVDDELPSQTRETRQQAYATEDLREIMAASSKETLPDSPSRVQFNLEDALQASDDDKLYSQKAGLQLPIQSTSSQAEAVATNPHLLHHAAAVGLQTIQYAQEAAKQVETMAGLPHGTIHPAHALNMFMQTMVPSGIPTSPTHSPIGVSVPPPPDSAIIGAYQNSPTAQGSSSPPWAFPQALPFAGAAAWPPYMPATPYPGFGLPCPPAAAPGTWPNTYSASMPDMAPPHGVAGRGPASAAPSHWAHAPAATSVAKDKGKPPSKMHVAAAAAADNDEPGAARTNGAARGPRGRARLWTHIYLHMQAESFDLVPMLIGRGGCNMKNIAMKTNAKVRIRGRGSGHLEIDNKQEAPTPLMVAVTTDHQDQSGFKDAVRMTLEILNTTSQRFQQFCEKKQLPCEGPFFSVGLLPEGAQDILGDILEGVPVAPLPTTQKESH